MSANPFDALQTENHTPSPVSPWTQLTYYSNSLTQTTWTKPLDLMTPLEIELEGLLWKEFESKGRKYYYKMETKETTWSVPREWSQIVGRWTKPKEEPQQVN
jgi:hypothetical protein